MRVFLGAQHGELRNDIPLQRGVCGQHGVHKDWLRDVINLEHRFLVMRNFLYLVSSQAAAAAPRFPSGLRPS